MPYRAKRECKHGGCRVLTDASYCPVHAAAREKEREALAKQYPSHGWNRGERVKLTAAQRGYGAAWQRISQHYRSVHPYCALCLEKGRYVLAQVVDHIQPHRNNDVLFWDMDNLQGLCKSCHARKSRAERSM